MVLSGKQQQTCIDVCLESPKCAILIMFIVSAVMLSDDLIYDLSIVVSFYLYQNMFQISYINQSMLFCRTGKVVGCFYEYIMGHLEKKKLIKA